MHKFSFDALGTRWNVTLWDCGGDECIYLQKDIQEQVYAFEQTFSRFIKTSYLQSLTHTTGIQSVPSDFVKILLLYKKLYTSSQKKFTPLIGSILDDLGYDEQYSFTAKKTVRQPPDFDDAVHVLDEQTIDIRQPVYFDIGAAGKGFLVDKISTYLRIHECKKFLVDAGGDLFYKGDEKIRIGLEHPEDASKAIGVLEFSGGAFCGSGCGKRAWGEYCHIIDPEYVRLPRDIRATWVMADSTALADGLATCLFLGEPELFQKDFSFEYCIVDENYKIKHSAGFLAEWF